MNADRSPDSLNRPIAFPSPLPSDGRGQCESSPKETSRIEPPESLLSFVVANHRQTILPLPAGEGRGEGEYFGREHSIGFLVRRGTYQPHTYSSLESIPFRRWAFDVRCSTLVPKPQRPQHHSIHLRAPGGICRVRHNFNLNGARTSGMEEKIVEGDWDFPVGFNGFI